VTSVNKLPLWDDRTVFIVGGGPSLRGFDFKRLWDAGHVVCVNQSMLDIDFCDAAVSMDHKFVSSNQDRLAKVAERCDLYLVYFANSGPRVPGAIYLIEEPTSGLSLDPSRVRTAGTSGHAALNVATLKGAKKIVLLGFDYGAVNGKHHYHDAYSWHKPEEQNWPQWAKFFDQSKTQCDELGIEVVNASPESTITAFPRMSIEEAMQWSN
jgi:hypothetical protein